MKKNLFLLIILSVIIILCILVILNVLFQTFQRRDAGYRYRRDKTQTKEIPKVTEKNPVVYDQIITSLVKEMPQHITVTTTPHPMKTNSSPLTPEPIYRYSGVIPSVTLPKIDKIKIVNQRPILTSPFLVSGSQDYPTLFSKKIYYNPFEKYAVPKPSNGAKRMWRIYAVYSDNINSDDKPILTFFVLDNNWDKVVRKVNFEFTPTFGTIEDERDGYSNLVEDPVEKMHCLLYSFITNNPNGDKKVKWSYAELQALDVYE